MKCLACLFAATANLSLSRSKNLFRSVRTGAVALFLMLLFQQQASGQTQLTFNLHAATFNNPSLNSTVSGFDQAVVGSLFRATTGSGSSASSNVNTGQTACNGATTSYTTGSNLFIFYTTQAITNITIHGTSTAASTRTLSAFASSTTVNGTYTSVTNSAGASTIGASCGSLTLNPTSAIPAGTFLRITLSGNMNIFGIVVTTQNPVYFYGGGTSTDITNANAWWTGYDVLTGLGSTGSHPSAVTNTNSTFVVQNTATAPTMSGSLSLGSGSKFIVGGATSNSATLTLPQALTGTVDVQSNGTLAVSSTTIPTLGTLSTGSTVSFTGSSSQSVPSKTYSNLTINNSAGASLASTATVASTLTLTNGALSGGSSLTMSTGATIVRNTGSLASAPTFGTTVNVTYANSSPVTSGPELPSSTSVLSALSTVGGSSTATIDANVTANGAITVNGSNLTINTAKTLTLAAASTLTVTTGRMDVNGTVVNQSSTSISLAPSPSFYVNSGGTYVHNTTAGISTPIAKFSLDNASTFIYRGSSSLATSISISGRTFGNLYFESTSGTFAASVSGSSTLTINGSLIVGNSGNVTFGSGFTGSIAVAGGITVNSGSSFTTTTNSVSLGGNWSQGGTYSTGANTVTFNGTGGQQQFTRTGSGNMSSLTLSNTAGLLLNNAMTLSGTLTLTSGALTLGANNLTVSSAIAGAPAFGTNGSNYVVTNGAGKLTIATIGSVLTGDVLFPVGNTSYNPLVINVGTASANTFAVSVGTGTVGGATAAESVNRIWTVSHSAGTDPAIVKTQWAQADENGSFVRASSQVVNSNGTSITDQGTIAAASGSDPYTQTSAIAINNFGSIGVITGFVTSTFYNKPGTDITVPGNWGANTDGTGSSPADFTTNYQVFNISNSGGTMGGAWTVSGSGTAINVGDGTNSVTFTQTQDITGSVNVKNAATLQIQAATVPTLGTLATGSTIDYAGSNQAITATNYSHLTLSGTGTTFPAGTVSIAGTFTPGGISTAAQGTVDFNGSGSQTIPAFNYTNLTSSSTGARTLASSGVIGIAGTFTQGSNTYTITGSTIDYNGSGTQSIVAMNYNNLSLSGSGTRTFPSGTVGIAGSFAPGIFTSASQGTVSFNGSSAQTIPAFAFNNITSANNAGTNIAGGTTVSFAGTATTALNISSGTLTVNGTLENKAIAATTSGNTTSTSASLVFASTGTYSNTATAASLSSTIWIPTATWQDSSNCNLAFSFAGTAGDYTGLYNVNQSFSNFTFNLPSLNGKLVVTQNVAASPATPWSVSGTMYVQNTGTSTGVQLLRSNTNSNTLAIGKYVQRAGNVFIAANTGTAATRVVNVSRDFILEGTSLFNVLDANGGTSTNNATLNLSGNLAIGSGCTLTRTSSSGTSVATLAFVGSGGDQTFTNNGSFVNTLLPTVVNKSAGALLMASNLTFANSLTLTAGVMNVQTNTLTLQSTVSRTNGSIAASSGSIVLNGTAQQTINTGIFSTSINNLTLNNSLNATITDGTTVNSALTLTSGALTVSGGLTIGNHALITRSAGTLSTVPSFNGDADVTYTNGSTISTGNEMPTGSSALRNLTMSGATVNLSANATVNGSAALNNGTLAVGTRTLNFEGPVAVTSGTLSSSTTGTVNFNGSSQTVPAINYGNLGFNGGSKTLTAGTTGIAGTFTNNAGTSHTVAGTTINFNGSGAQTIPSFNYENLQTSTGGTKTLGSSLNITGNVSIGSSTTLATSNNNIGITGNWIQDGSFTPGTGTVSFYSGNAQSISGSTNGTFYTLSISKSANDFTVTTPATIFNRLQLEAGNVINANNLTMASAAKIIREAGSLDAAPTFSGIVDLEFGNSSDLTAGSEVPSTDIVRNFTITGGGKVTMNRSVRVNGTLTLTSGIVDLDAFNLSAAAGSVTGGSSSSYIRTSGSGAFTIRNVPNSGTDFPVGNSTYNPLQIANPVALDWSVRVEDAVANVTGGYAPNVAKAVSRQWDITPSQASPVPGGGATITFYYDGTSDVGGSFSNATDVQVWHYYQGFWAKRGTATTPSNVGGMKAVTVGGLTYFSPYAISNIDAPLPVSLLSFTGKRNGSVNELKWKTASESNNRGFAIERSADGVTFTQVGFLNSRAAGGNSTSDISYAYSETLTAGSKWYYRLKQVDFDGQYKYSAVVLLKGDKSGMISVEGIYPNPVKGSTSIRLQAGQTGGTVVLQLTDMLGKVVRTTSITTEAGSATTVQMNLTGLAAGQYHLKAIAGSEVSETVTVVKQ